MIIILIMLTVTHKHNKQVFKHKCRAVRLSQARHQICKVADANMQVLE